MLRRTSRFPPPLLWLAFAACLFCSWESPYRKRSGAPKSGRIELLDVITGHIQPKSVAHSGRGLFFAQNMMYEHTITVYNRNRMEIQRISDEVVLRNFGFTEYPEGARYKGAPVECAFSHDGKYAWISNYHMTGPGFTHPGDDNCVPGGPYDPSFVYKINTQNFVVEEVIKVGSVPKYLAISPDNRYLLVSNWCSGDLSVVDTRQNREVRRIPLGAYPRGIAIDVQSRHAYIALMGEGRIAVLRLSDFNLNFIERIGATPRHLCLEQTGRYLYVSQSRPGKIIKFDLVTQTERASVYTGPETRSIVLAPDESCLYAVSYGGHTLSKVSADKLQLLEQVNTRTKPIGVTFDPMTRTIWVSCYSSAIQVFFDANYPAPDLTPPPNTYVVAATTTPSFSAPWITFPPAVPGREGGSAFPFRPDYELPEPALPAITSRKADRPNTAPESAPPSLADGNFVLVAGTFAKKENAESETEYLRKQGFPHAHLRPTDMAWRVIGGCFASRQQAELARQYLQRTLSRDSWIMTP